MVRALAILAAAVCAVARPAAAREYTLPQLLAKVRADYPGVRIAERNLDAARAQEAQAARAWAPTGALDFTIFGAGRNNCAPPNGTQTLSRTEREHNCYTFSLLQTLNSGSGLLEQIPIWGVAVSLRVTLNQPLYSFGKIEAGVAIAQSGVDSAKESLRVASEDAALNAARAYWGVKTARSARATLLDIIKRLDEWVHKLTAEMEGANKAAYTEADLARLKTAVDSVILVQLDIEKGLAYAEEGLRVLTDDPEADVDKEELALAELVPHPLEWYEEAARLHRPEARLAAVVMRSAVAVRRLRRAELTPDLSLVSRLDITYQSSAESPHNAFMYRPNHVDGSWSLLARMPIDIPLRLERLKLARADEEAQRAREKDALGGIAIDVARAFGEHEEARHREERMGHGEKVARGWLSIVDTNMGQGLAAANDARELVDAARVYFEFRLRRLQAIMDANVTWSALQRATGAL